MEVRVSEVTVTTTSGSYLCEGMQLRPRKLVPKWFGDLVLWLFFHRIDTATRVTLSGFSE